MKISNLIIWFLSILVVLNVAPKPGSDGGDGGGDPCGCFSISATTTEVGDDVCYDFVIKREVEPKKGDVCQKDLSHFVIGPDVSQCPEEAQGLANSITRFANSPEVNRDYDGVQDGTGVSGFKVDFECSDECEFTMCFDADEVCGFSESARIGWKRGNQGYDCPASGVFPEFCCGDGGQGGVEPGTPCCCDGLSYGSCPLGDGKCDCDEPYYGDCCEFECDCVNGVCDAEGKCSCNEDFYGDTCEDTCCCEETGKCDEDTGECTECNEGFDYIDGCCEPTPVPEIPPCCCEETGKCDEDTGACTECNDGFDYVDGCCVPESVPEPEVPECCCEMESRGTCDEITGEPICNDGLWGPCCENACCCLFGGICDPVDGSCNCDDIDYYGNCCQTCNSVEVDAHQVVVGVDNGYFSSNGVLETWSTYTLIAVITIFSNMILFGFIYCCYKMNNKSHNKYKVAVDVDNESASECEDEDALLRDDV